MLELPCPVEAVVEHQHPEESHRQTQRVALYPAPHPASLALPPLPAVFTTCLPTSLIRKPARSFQFQFKPQLKKRLSDRGSGYCDRGRCLDLDQWSQAAAASIDLVTETWRVSYLQPAVSWSSTCGTASSWWVGATRRRWVMQQDALGKHQLKRHTGR